MSIFIMEDVVYVFTVSLTIIVLKIYRIPRANLLDPSIHARTYTHTHTHTHKHTHKDTQGYSQKKFGVFVFGGFRFILCVISCIFMSLLQR